MERRALSALAKKLSISSDSILRKAEEYMCLLDIRAGSSSVAVLRPSGASKAAMCLELAANACGEHVDRANTIRVSGMTKKLYMNALRAVQCLLDLQPNTNIPDMAIQFGVSQARPLAVQIIQSYDAEHSNEDSATYSRALFNGAALITACRRMKLKVDKNKLVDLAGCKKSTLDRLVALMDKQAEKILASSKKSVKGKRSRTFLDELQDIPDSACQAAPAKVAKQEETNEDFEEWKRGILVKAYSALGKKYQAAR